jgi:hypothetical protein
VIQDASASLCYLNIDLLDSKRVYLTGSSNWDRGIDHAFIPYYRLRFSGSYIIRTYTSSGSVGGYKLTLSVKPPPSSIAYGQDVKGQITIPTDYQEWAFDGQAEDIITIRVVQDGGASLSYPDIDLLDPTRIYITSGSNWDQNVDHSFIPYYSLRFSGTYIIRVYSKGTYTGRYRLSLTKEYEY